MKMKFVIDENNNIGYLYMDEKKKDQIANTIEVDKMNIDIAKDGHVIGIEFLDIKEQFRDMFSKSKLTFGFQNIDKMDKPVYCEVA